MTEPIESPSTLDASPSLGEPLLVEDVLLLLFQPDSGTIAGENTLFYVLGGAALGDLAMTARIETEKRTLGTRVHGVGDGPLDPLLTSAWEYAAEKPRGVQTVLAAIGPRLREPVLDRLVERGDLLREEKKVLGFIPSERLSLAMDRRAGLIGRVRAVLTDGEEPDTRTAAIVALLSASGTLPQFDREISWTGDVYTRAKALERGDWGAAAAGAAVARTIAAVVTTSTVSALLTSRS